MIRVLLALAVFAFFALCVYGMWRGWQRRANKQAETLPAFPAKPEKLGPDLLPSTTGVYVGTVNAGDWQDRVQVGDIGHRSAATLRLVPEGLLVERAGAADLFVPTAAIKQVTTERGLAGKVMFGDGLLVFRWEIENRVFDTGFRGDDKDVYEQWISALVSQNKSEGSKA